MGILGSGLKLEGYSSASQNDGKEKGGSSGSGSHGKISRIGREDFGGDDATGRGGGGKSNGRGTNVADARGGVGGIGDAGEVSVDSHSGGNGGAKSAATGATSGGYGGLTGLMGRVLGASSATASGGSASLINDIEEEDLSISSTRPVLPPRSRCVAASNGWIIAAVECVPPPTLSSFPSSTVSALASSGGSSGGGGNTILSKHAQSLIVLIPPLRLVSRWNVRRGSSLGSEGNHLIPLPPPVRPLADSITASSGNDAAVAKQFANNPSTSIYTSSDPNFGRIVHTFVDPTGCHVLLSARNGEAYYLHSTSKKVKKLAGFGPNADGSYSEFVPGVPLGEAGDGGGSASGGSGEVVCQTGLTPGSYVTAVGWDRDRGTEGSTKRFLLGTSTGELYEYALVSPNAAPSTTPSSSAFSVNLRGGTSGAKSAFDAKAGELSAQEDVEERIEAPVLLRRLNSSSPGSRSTGDEACGAVGGILFQRINGSAGGSVMVLVSTGGLHRHTRLHTFRSEPSKGSASLSLRSAFSRKREGSGRGSFVDLPGSVDFSDLSSCNDAFALRTETGIYYGTMDRIISSSSSKRGGTGGISDAGMLPYDNGFNSKRDAIVVPTSTGLTPHHFITLTSMNEVRFINRVARRVIQQERVDWMSLSQMSSTDDTVGKGNVPELFMDIRRPDQVWLRKGRSLVHISSSCEDRDVWKYTLMKCIDTGSRRQLKTGETHISRRAHTALSDEKSIDNQFEHAKSLCSNSSQKAVVTAVRAEYHLSNGHVELAAKYMAQCPSTLMPFADTASRLALPMLGLEELPCIKNSLKANEALSSSNLSLIAYLTDKMKVAKSKNDSVICTMLGAWLTELHLHERQRDGAGKPVYLRQEAHNQQQVDPALLHQFLSTFVRDMDATSVIKVLESHDINAGECAGYSAAAGDIGTAINAALCGDDGKNGAMDALRVLNDSPIEKAEPFYYKHALTLLSRAPMPAAKSFLSRYSEGLSETKLLPAFMHYERKRAQNKKALATAQANSSRNPQKSNQTTNTNSSSQNMERLKVPNFEIGNSRTFGDSGVEIHIDHTELALSGSFVDDENASVKYFEGVIALGSKSRAVFNYLTSLYAGMEDEGPLFRFLSTHVPSSNYSARNGDNVGELMLRQAHDERLSPLDKSFALRTILRMGRHYRSAVKLYMGFGMRQQAVELALKVDPALARELARQSDDKDERKRLWLMIARSAAANGSLGDGKDVVARVVSVLKDCGPDVLSIEDVLPFLPDFAQIDQFKDEICNALASYSSKIENHLKEMSECDQTCDALREELSRLQNVGIHVNPDARCAFTNKLVIDSGEPFYAFPSGYVVLESALEQEIFPHLNEKQRARVELIESELKRLRQSSNNRNRAAYDVAKDNFEIDELQNELDGLIAAECPLTGLIMVESIDRGFLDDGDGD